MKWQIQAYGLGAAHITGEATRHASQGKNTEHGNNTEHGTQMLVVLPGPSTWSLAKPEAPLPLQETQGGGQAEQKDRLNDTMSV